MLIRNITSKHDLDNKRRLQAVILQAQIDNEALLENRVKDYKNPNKPPAVPPQYRTNNEILKDNLTQQKEAIDNLRSIGLDYATAAQTSQDLVNKLPDGTANLLKLNKNFPFIKSDILKRYNVKLLDASTLIEYFKEYFEEIDNTIGISLPSSSSTNYFNKEALTGREIATKEVYEILLNNIDTINDEFNINPEMILILREAIDKLKEEAPTEAQIDAVDTFDNITRQRIQKTMNIVKKIYPSTELLDKVNDKLITYIREKGVKTNAIAGAKNAGFETGGQQNAPDEVINALVELSKSLKNLNKNSINYLRKLKYNINQAELTFLKEKEDVLKVDVPDIPEETGEETKEPMGGRKIPEKIIAHQENILELNEQKKKMNDERYEDNRKYIMGQINKLSINKAYERLALQDYEPYADFINGVPKTPNDSVIYEYVNIYTRPTKKSKTEKTEKVEWKLKEKHTELKNPIVIVGGRALYFTGEKADLNNYLLMAVANKYEEEGDGNPTVVYEDSGEELRRFNLGEAKEIIRQKETMMLLDRLKADETYNPKNFTNQHILKTNGFGLTNNIIKHFDKDNRDMTKLSKSLENHLKVEARVDDEISSDEEKPKKRGGSANFSARRIKIGRGLAPMEKEPIHKEFGKYIINMRQLKSGYLNLKHPSGSQIPSIPTVEISKNYREFVLDVLENSKVNQRHYDILTNPEKAHFTNITKKAKLFEVLKFKPEENEEENNDLKRLELLFGEINAGNDNPKMIKECKTLIKKYIANGKIEQSKGLNMLMELD